MLHKERAKVLRTVAIAKEIPIGHEELLGHWGRYACLVCAGYFEVALRIVIKTHLEQKASPDIQSFVLQTLEAIQNPKAERFVKVLRSFSGEWGDQLEKYFQNNAIVKEALDSLMANRHLIAHGKSCSISVGRVETYFKAADKRIDFVDATINTP